nr:hypothetical protein [Pedobacter panaciterrae]
MKKILLNLALITLGYDSFAQTNTFPASGSVGIGTTAPASLLHLNGITTTNPLGAVILTIQAAHSSATLGSGGIIKFTNNLASADAAAIKTYTEGAGNVSLRFQTGYGTGTLVDRMTISNTGNVGIGTTTPNAKLAVNGTIRAKEVKVETANWPDYVFAKEYKLPSLKETEEHILQQGHLPGIPSAAEVKANGVDLGEMNAKLLQKIEEMTLIMIELSKKVEDQSKVLKKQQKQLNKLK